MAEEIRPEATLALSCSCFDFGLQQRSFVCWYGTGDSKVSFSFGVLFGGKDRPSHFRSWQGSVWGDARLGNGTRADNQCLRAKV